MRRLLHASDLLVRFRHDRRGNILIMFCFLLVGLFLLAGGAVDLARAVMLRNALQDAADAAALAGATNFSSASAFSARQEVATDYMKASIADLPDNDSIKFVVSPFATDSNGTTTAYNVKITAEGRARTTFMSLLVQAIPVSVVATATYPLGNTDDTSNGYTSDLPDILPAGDDPQLYTRARDQEMDALGPEQSGARLTQ